MELRTLEMRDGMTREELTQAYNRGEITQAEVLALAGANVRSHQKEEMLGCVEELLRQFHADSPRPKWKKALTMVQEDFRFAGPAGRQFVKDVLKTIGKWEDDWEGDDDWKEGDDEDDEEATFLEGHEALDDECGVESDTAFLSCQCGKVEISLPNKSIQRYRCCCCDCRKGLEYFHTAKGGPAPPAIPDLVYYPNVLMVCEGHSHLRCFTLQKGFPTRRIYAACCWTPLLADHPGYEGNRVVVYNRPAKLKCTGTFAYNRSPLRRPDGRIFESDLSAAELGSLPSFQPPRDARSWPDATRDALTAVTAMADPSTGGWRHKWSMWKLVTVQQLIASLPRGVEVADPAHQGPIPAYARKRRSDDNAAGGPSPKACVPQDVVALDAALDAFLSLEADDQRDVLTDRLASGVDDVSSLLWQMLPPGRRVFISGLQARPELNGECGVVTQQEPGGERCAVSVGVHGGLQDIRVKLANLRPKRRAPVERREATRREATRQETTRPEEHSPPATEQHRTGRGTGRRTRQGASVPVSRASFIPCMITDSGALERAQTGMVDDLAKRMGGTLDAHTYQLRSLVRDIVVQAGAQTPDEIWTVFLSKLVEVDGPSAAEPEKQLDQWKLIEPVADQILHEVYPDWFRPPGSATGGDGRTVSSPPAIVDSGPGHGGPGTPPPQTANGTAANGTAANDAEIHSVLASSDATIEVLSAALEQYGSDASSDAVAELKRRRERLKRKQKKERQRERRGQAHGQDDAGARGAADPSGPAASSASAADEPPDEFMCPITQEVMADPVVAADGHTYERAAIERWVAKKMTSPRTGGALESATIFPNHSIRRQIREWQEKQ